MSKWNPFKRNRLGDSDIDPIDILTEPTGTSPMTDHAEQHSALTQIQRENVLKFEAVEQVAGTNAYEIEQNADTIRLNTNDLAKNMGDIADNTEAIAENATAIADNTYQISGVYKNLESFAAAINENKAEIAADKVAITDNALGIVVLDNRVSQVEEFLGAVEFEIPLGSGSWTFDSLLPPPAGHFTAFSSVFNKNNDEFWISFTDSKASDLSKWATAKAGDRFDVVGDDNNYGYYVLETITRDQTDQYYDINAKFLAGQGGMGGGIKYDITITRLSKEFEPSDSLGGSNQGHAVSGRMFNFGDSNSPGGFYADANGIFFNKTDANGLVRVMPEGSDFSWDERCKITLWDTNGTLIYAMSAGKSTAFSDERMVFKPGTIHYNKSLKQGSSYDCIVDGYW